MATAYRGFQLGLLPERKINKRALATSYGLVTLAVLMLINLSLLLPEKLQLTQYHVTELIPMPALRPEPAPIKPKPEVKAKLLPAVKLPVFEQPKLLVPREVRRQAPQPVEAPKVVVNQFVAPVIKVAGGARPQLVHTGDFRRKFADADGKCGGRESADRRFRRSEWTDGHGQAGREVVQPRHWARLTCR